VKTTTRIGLVFCFCSFAALTSSTQSVAAEYYTYKDAQGNLVISNKTPPPGSTILRKHELPEAPQDDVAPPPEGAASQTNGESENPPPPSKQ
jgi:hypothetical protein